MTIEAQTPRNSYIGNGVNDTFAFTFTILKNSDLEVTVNSVLQIEGATYTLENVTENGGDVVFLPGFIPVANSSVILQRNTDETQEVVYTPFDPFPAKTHEGALDKLTMLIQESRVLASVAGGLPLDPTGTFWEAGARQLKHILTPTDADDAATKAYADAIIGGGFDPTEDQIISGFWTFTQIINGICLGNLVADDLLPYTQREISEAITGAWSFVDGAGSLRKVGARNPRERLVIANDTPSQSDEGAILRITAPIATITLEPLEPQTMFEILSEASGYVLESSLGVVISHFDGLGGAQPVGDKTIARSSAVQIMYKSITEVSIYGNGIS